MQFDSMAVIEDEHHLYAKTMINITISKKQGMLKIASHWNEIIYTVQQWWAL